MKTLLRYAIFAFVFGVLLLSASAVESRGQVINEILRRMDQNNKSLQSLQAGVTMVKTNVQLNVSDTNVGTTSYLTKTAKRYIRVDWTKPVEEQISIIGDDYELYRPRLQQVIVGKTNKTKNSSSVGGALAFMNMSREQLKANYDVKYIGEEQVSGGVNTWHLELTPKTATTYKNADLWIDVDGMPRQAKVTEQNNDTTTVLLSNIQKNVVLKAEIFKLKYPGSVKKIKA
jgi:outer membrane lipoprotein-sorting protein